MTVLPCSRRGTWLLALAVWLTACAALWVLLPHSPRAMIAVDPLTAAYDFAADGKQIITFTLAERPSFPLAETISGTIRVRDTSSLKECESAVEVRSRMKPLRDSLECLWWILEPQQQGKHGFEYLFDQINQRIFRVETKTREISRELAGAEILDKTTLAIEYKAADGFSIDICDALTGRVTNTIQDCRFPVAISADGSRLAATRIIPERESTIEIIDRTTWRPMVTVRCDVLVDTTMCGDDSTAYPRMRIRDEDKKRDFFRKGEYSGETFQSARDRSITPDFYTDYRLVSPTVGQESLTIDFRLDPGSNVRVAVTGPDGQPLTGAKVSGISPSGIRTTSELEGTTFTARALGPGEKRQVAAIHLKNKLAGVATITADDPGSKTIRLEPCTVVTGKLIDRDGEPLSGLRITYSGDVTKGTESLMVSGLSLTMPIPRLAMLTADFALKCPSANRGTSSLSAAGKHSIPSPESLTCLLGKRKTSGRSNSRSGISRGWEAGAALRNPMPTPSRGAWHPAKDQCEDCAKSRLKVAS
jgi:hypothetical protein